MKIDAGCGRKKKDGYVGIDKVPPADIICDLEKERLPFKDESIDEIYTSHFLEHVDNFEEVMFDFHRTLKPNGILEIKVPYFRYPMVHHPLHKAYFSLDSLQVFYKEDYYNKKYFELIERRFEFTGIPLEPITSPVMRRIAKKNPYLYENIFAVFFPPRRLYFKLKKLPI